MQNDYGAHYLLDLERNSIRTHHVDIEDYARQLGVLADSEEVAENATTAQ